MKLAVLTPTPPSHELLDPKSNVVARGDLHDTEASLAREMSAWARHAANSNGFSDGNVEG